MPANLYTSSNIINGQLVPQARTAWYTPFAVGPVVQGVPASPPQSAPGFGGTSSGGGAGGVAPTAGANPWSPVTSPVPWLIGMFLAGYLLMRYVHWGYRK